VTVAEAACEAGAAAGVRAQACGRAVAAAASPVRRTLRACGWGAALVGGAAAVGCRPVRPAVQFLGTPAEAARPFSPAVRAGGLLFLAGQLGTDSTGRLVPGGVQPETRQAMANIRAVLERAGSSLDRVVKCTVFLADMREWGAMNAVYTTFFAPGRRPARTAAGASGLALDARVEIECVAAG
jgi:reactive intermediate/imine deaminase